MLSEQNLHDLWKLRVRRILRNTVVADLSDVLLGIDVGNLETEDVRIVGYFVLGTCRHLCEMRTRGSQRARNERIWQYIARQ